LKVSIEKIAIIFLLSWSFGSGSTIAVTTSDKKPFELTRLYSQITTHPEIDLYPSISPDGKWLAFASKRSGNMDIWIKPVAGGTAVQITNHRTDDMMPSWSPDGKSLVFVSYREDALGDLWLVSLIKRGNSYLSTGQPRKLTNYLGMDIVPQFSPNGQWIAFTSDRDGKENIYVLALRNKKVFQITKSGGINPSWSHDKEPKIAYVAINPETKYGQIFYAQIDLNNSVAVTHKITPITNGQTNDAFPFWNPLKNEIIFTRYDEDTNYDGIITPDDNATLWKVIISDETNNGESSQPVQFFQELQLMPKLGYDFYPVCSRDSVVYFVSNRSGNEDIWSVPADGPIPFQPSAYFQYQFALMYFPLPETDLVYKKIMHLNPDLEQLEYRQLAFNRVMDLFPHDIEWSGWALYEIAKTLTARGEYQTAKNYYAEILTQFVSSRELMAKAKMRLLELEAEKGAQIDSLKKIISTADIFPAIQAEAQFYVGESFYLQNLYRQALGELEKLIAAYRTEDYWCAAGQLLIGDIYSKFGQTKEVINSYLKVVNAYPHQEYWINLALERIIELSRKEDSSTTISELRNVISYYAQFPRLAARAQYSLGKLFAEMGDINAAKEEYELVLQKYPQEKAETALAALALAKIFMNQKEDVLAFQHYRTIIENYGDTQGGIFVVEAKELLVEAYLESGKRLLADREYNAAYSRFRSAIEIMPRHIDAHRNLILLMYLQGRIDQAIRWYENMVLTHADDEILLYMLGLCYSYKATEASDRSNSLGDLNVDMMKKSNYYIESALAKNYRIIQGYLTLGYNYEFIERHEQFQRSSSKRLLTSVLITMVAPIKSLFNFVTMQKEKKPKHWYELAIDALTTAIALNDEKTNPMLESELALNLANNYYNLGEFGYERAYYYYHVKLEHDSTFVNKRMQAEIFRKMGHCAYVTEDFSSGPKYLIRAIQLYKELGDDKGWLNNIKRLALLYQSAEQYDVSIEYFKQAALYDEQKKNYQDLETDYRSIAYNYQLLNDEEEAIRYAQKAIELIQSDKIKEVKPQANWIKIGILGIEFPVWNLGQIGTGASTAASGFTTDEERALIYSIIGNSRLNQKSLDQAIFYLEKRYNIFRSRHDKIAEAIFLNNIGYLYFCDFQYHKAWDYYERSFKICEKEKNFRGMLINIINIASLGTLLEKLDLLPPQPIVTAEKENNGSPSSSVESAINYVQQGIDLIEAQIGFAAEKAQLYLLLGNLYLSQAEQYSLNAQREQVEKINSQLKQLEKLSLADSCYQVALKISDRNGFYEEKMQSLHKLGYLSFAIGDLNDALDNLFDCRDIAKERSALSMIWQVDLMIGKILSNYSHYPRLRRSRQSASFYLDEAIAILEQSSLQNAAFIISPFYRHQVRLLFEAASHFAVSNGNYLSALRLAEQYRGKQYLDLISSHKLELKKERHKIFLGNARFIKSEIASLREKIEREKEKAPEASPYVPLWSKQKMNYEKEYADLLIEVSEEDEELESLIASEPVIFSQVQKILAPRTKIIDYFFIDQVLHAWEITPDNVELKILPARQNEINDEIRNFLSDIQNDSSYQKSGLILWKKILEPLADKIDSVETIIVIPDGPLQYLPFNYLFNFIATPDSENNHKSVSVASSLSNYYYSFLKRKIKKPKLLWASTEPKNELVNLGYDASNSMKLEDFSKIGLEQFIQLLNNSDMIFLDVRYQRNDNDPLLSVVAVDNISTIHIKLKDFYKYDFAASLLVLNVCDSSEIFSDEMLQRVMLYSGFPSLVIGEKYSPENPFWQYFFEALQDYTPAKAITLAQKKMQHQGFAPANFAFFQLYGFEGMDSEQESAFAKERFETKVALGNEFYEEHDWQRALINYEQALAMAKKQNAQAAIENLYQLILECAANGSYWDKAIEYQLDMVETAKFENNVQRLAEGLKYLVYFFSQNKDYAKALFYQSEYLDLAKSYQLPEEVAGSYLRLGLVHEQNGDYGKATAYFSQAIDAYRTLGDSLSIAECYKNRARIYLLKLDNYAKAVRDQERALAIFKKVNATDKLMEVQQNLGLSHEYLANYQTALKYQLDALSLATASGNSQWLALSKQYLANVYWKMGNYEQALFYQKQALQAFSESGNQKLQSVGLSTQGLILMSLGNLTEALDLEKRALEFARQLRDSLDVATIHKNISALFRSQKLWDSAKVHIEIAKQIDEAIGSKRGLGYDFRDLGIIEAQQGITAAAFRHFRRGLKISQEISDARNLSQCFYQIGLTYSTVKNHAAAIDTLALAAQMAEKLFIPEVEWRAYRTLALIYEEKNDFEQSLTCFHKALAVIEAMRSEIKIEEYKSGFMDNKLDVYYDLVGVYLKLNRPAQALEIVERAKSRNFIDLLANRDINFSGDYDKDKFDKLKRMKEEISKVQNEITQILVHQGEMTSAEKEQVEKLALQLESLKKNYQDFLIQLKEQNPELAQMVVVEPIKIDDLQKAIPEQVVFLEYFYTDEQITIWALTKELIFAKQEKISSAALYTLVDSLRSTLEKQGSVDRISKRLYQILIAPAEEFFADATQIIIVPHGILHYLPFSCLMNEKQEYLVDKFSISLSPSAMVLKLCLQKGKGFIETTDWNKNILALGNPDLGDDAFDLPFAELEIESLELLYPQVNSFLRQQATEEKFKALCSRFNLIIFSCHGEFDPLNPLFSALRLAAGQYDDGRLEAHEIFELTIDAYLVAMSACETGLAKIGVGDEVVGLSRSFIYAGTASLLSSLWKVDDLATAVLIKRFFRNLKSGDSRATALRKAQLFVRDNINVHPVYWSAFNITGDFR